MPELPHDDAEIVARLRAGDEDAFASLVTRYRMSMVRVALMYVPSEAVAEEVVQETWIGVLKGIDAFEGRSSLKTWIFRILANVARTRGERERRSVPFSSLAGPDEPSVSPDRFLPADDPEWPHHWDVEPNRPEMAVLSGEALELVRSTIATLPAGQRAVITLRDVEGYDSKETCNVLGIAETNQRVLLHRARSKVRRALEPYLDPSAERSS